MIQTPLLSVLVDEYARARTRLRRWPPMGVRGHRGAALFCALALVLLAFLFRDAILHGDVLGQADCLFAFPPWDAHRPPGWRIRNPLLGDVPTVFYPFLLHARSVILAGGFPLWNSAVGTGQPFFAAFQTAVLSPFSAVAYVLPFPAGFTAAVAARLFVGGLGMYVFLRRLPLSAEASIFGGVAFLLNPFSIVWLEHPLSAVAAWMPWLLATVDRCARNGDRRSVAAFAAGVAVTILAGHPETAFKVFLFTGSYAVYRATASGRMTRTLAVVCGGALLGALLCSIQLLPFLEYVVHSRVFAMRALDGRPLFLNPASSFVTAFVPDFYGTPLGHRFALDGTNYNEQQTYPGVVTWAFAAMALLHRQHRGRAVFFFCWALVAALIMYGTFVTRVALVLVPPLRVVALSRFGLITITGVAIGAAVGVDAFLDDGTEARRRLRLAAAVTAMAAAIGLVVFGFLHASRDLLAYSRVAAQTARAVTRAAELLGAAVALVWLAPALLRPMASVFAIALVSVDLLAFAAGFHPFMPRALVFPEIAEFDVLRRDPSVFRVTGWQDALLPNTAMVYGLRDVRSYDGIGLREYSDLLDVGFKFNGVTHQFVNTGTLHLVDLLNVKYVVTGRDVELPANHFQLVNDGPSRLYLNTHVQPRAFLADAYRVLDRHAALRTLRDASVDLTRVVVLNDRLDPALQPDAAGNAVGTAAIRRYEDGAVTIETRADGRRLLVLTDVFYPGWIARVDGVEVPIQRADFAFRAVGVPPGEHVVEFRYEPASVRYGAWLSLAGAIVLLALIATARTSVRS